jgi:hypothetical protein
LKKYFFSILLSFFVSSVVLQVDILQVLLIMMRL